MENMFSKHLIKTLGLALVAMAVMVVGASAAFGASEFKAKGGGNPAGITFTGSGNTATFETETKATVTCEKSKSTGKVLSSKEAEVTITYEGKCKLAGAAAGNGSCSNVTGTENIKTETLKGKPGTVPNAAGTKRGLLITGNTKGELAKFTCQGGVTITVTGAVVCESTPVKTLSLTGKVICAKGAKAGEQLFTEIEVEGKQETGKFLEAEGKVGFIKFLEKDSQVTTETLTYSAEIEQT